MHALQNMTKRSASRTQGDLTGPLDQDFVPKLQALAQVSKAWHLVVKTSPSLWTFVTNLDSSAAVALTLRKSKGLPLDVELSGTSAQDVREGGRLGKTEELILAQTHRWRCLELSTLKPKHRLVERVMRSDPPHLKGLMINNCSVAVAIPNGVLGRLHHLEVHGTPIRWAYFPSSCNLKTLRLRSDNSKHCPTLVQLLAILRAAPGLLVLGLHFPSLEQSPPSNDSPLSLLQLTTLFLRLPQHAIDSILARIQFPSCTRLMLVNTSFQMTDLQRLSISHLTSAIQSVMSSFRHVKITVSASTVALSGVGGLNAAHHTRHPDLRIELQTQILSSLLLSLNAILESVVPVPSITLVHTSATPFDLIHPFLCTLCPITELHLVDPTEDMIQDYATLLGEPCGPADATNRWSLPHLKVLTLRSRQVNPKLLLKTLRRRYGKPQDTRERPIESMPAALGLLAVEAETSLSDKNRGKLEEILGVEKVTWSIPGQSEH